MMLPEAGSGSVKSMNRLRCSAAGMVLAALSSAAHATIAPANSGNGELFLVIQDPVAQISYTLDLGERMDTFFIDAQQDAGIQKFWSIDPTVDTRLQSFLGQTQLMNHAWAVLAADSLGPVTGGNQRLFATARQGEEGNIASTLNAGMRSGIGSPMVTYFGTLNVTGTHGVEGELPDIAVNGSSVNNITDPGTNYFGEPGGIGPRLQANVLSFDMTNAVGRSSWFYALSSNAANGTVTVDEFDNLGVGNAGDGYFGFTFVDPNQNPTSPYANRWLLSYTLAPALVQNQTVTALGRERASLTEHRAGDLVRLVAAPDGEFLSFYPISPVPEPGALLLLGVGALALLARRRWAPVRRADGEV